MSCAECQHEEFRSDRCVQCDAPVCETCWGEGVIYHQWAADPPGAPGLWREAETCPACKGGKVREAADARSTSE